MSEIVPIDDKLSDTSFLLDKTIDGMVEGLTGLASSSRKEIVLSAGHLFQHCRNLGFLNGLKIEWEKLREKGKIKDDYMKTVQHKDCLGQLLEALDKDNPDHTKLDLLKKIFLMVATEKKSNRDSILPYQYMVIARMLTSGEALVLEAAYKIAKERSYHSQEELAHNAFVHIANESGLKYKDLVDIYDRSLVEKGLFMKRMDSTYGEKVGLGKHYRFTDLGWEFCKFVDTSDIDLSNDG